MSTYQHPKQPSAHAYQQQDSAMTLSEGLVEYYAGNAGLKRGESLAAPAREFFRCHDACHVVFGCGTSLAQEAVVKLSSLFGTTAGVSVLRGYALFDSLDIYRQLNVGEMLATIAAAPLIMLRTIARRLRQARRWPWSEFEAFLDTPLAEIRRQFGIII
jgi:ubiquinone biosynthesis protein Coq4